MCTAGEYRTHRSIVDALLQLAAGDHSCAIGCRPGKRQKDDMQERAHRLCIVLSYAGESELGHSARAASSMYLSSQFRPILRDMTAAFHGDCGWPKHVTCQSRQVITCSTFTCGCSERQDMLGLTLLLDFLLSGRATSIFVCECCAANRLWSIQHHYCA